MKAIILFIALITASFSSFAQLELDKLLVTSFKQSSVTVSTSFKKCSKDFNGGNCATIALVKAAMGQFKTLNNIFKEFKIIGNLFFIKFNDDIEATISKNDIDSTIKYSGVVNNTNPIYYDSAMIIYTAICKRVLVTKHNLHSAKEGYNKPKCVNNFRDAIDYISSGYPTNTVHELMGFKKAEVSINDISTEPSLIIYDKAHAAYCSNGFQDIFGEEFLITGDRMKNPKRNWIGKETGQIIGAYKLAK